MEGFRVPRVPAQERNHIIGHQCLELDLSNHGTQEWEERMSKGIVRTVQSLKEKSLRGPGDALEKYSDPSRNQLQSGGDHSPYGRHV